MQKRKRSNSQSPGSSKFSPTERRLERILVKRMQREVEKKGVDVTFSINQISDVFNTNADVYVLNAILAGANSYERTGRKVRHLSLRVKGLADLTAVSRSNLLRMIVVWDKQPTGSLPTFNTMFQDQDLAGATASSISSMVRYDQMDRFKVLRDKTMPVNLGCTPPASTPYAAYVEFDEFIKLDGLETIYNDGTTGTIADITTGALYLVFRADLFDATNSHLDVDCVARLRYTD